MILFIEKNTLRGEEFVSKCLLLLKNSFGYDVPEPEFARNECGKPYFVNISNLKFSCSHSGGVTVALFAETDCGVDIERYRTLDFIKITKRFFPDIKISNIKDFFDEWVKREADCKRQGLRLLDTIKTEPENSRIIDYMKDFSIAVSAEKNEPVIIFDFDQFN